MAYLESIHTGKDNRLFAEWSKEPSEPRRFPTFAEVMELEREIEKMPDIMDMIFSEARATVADLEGKNIPAAELTEKQKAAIYLLAGFLKYENGKMVSIRPVGIADNGRGGYIVGIAPE
jgi:hypothetical protein